MSDRKRHLLSIDDDADDDAEEGFEKVAVRNCPVNDLVMQDEGSLSLEERVKRRKLMEFESSIMRFIPLSKRSEQSLDHIASGNVHQDRAHEYLQRPLSITQSQNTIVADEQMSRSRAISARIQDKDTVADWDASDDTIANAQFSPLWGEERPIATFSVDRLDKASDVGETSWREKPLHTMKAAEWRMFREEFGITVRGSAVPVPLRSWAEAGLPSLVLNFVLKTLKFEEPTPVQRQCIPVGLARRDLIAMAHTGSGKTLAFLLPLTAWLTTLPRASVDDGPFAVILAPTRELATQIFMVAKGLFDPLGVATVPVIGGSDLSMQTQAFRSGCDVIVATPGRLIESIDSRLVSLGHCKSVILDEADKMMAMDMEPQLTAVLNSIKPSDANGDESSSVVHKGSVVMFSATMPRQLDEIARKYMHRPIVVTVGHSVQVPPRVSQRFIIVEQGGVRLPRLLEILHTERSPIMVFCNTKACVEDVGRVARQDGLKVAVLHSGKSQDARDKALADFKSGRVAILVATDVAGRGIDVADVSLVVNYELPSEVSQYVHRIGRTGRAGKAGVAISFISSADSAIVPELRALLQRAGQAVPPELRRVEKISAGL